MKKNLSMLTIVILVIMGLTGCYSKEEKELAKQYEKRGKEYAIEYIEEKYNFKPKIESVTSLRNCNSVWGCLESSPSDKVEIKMIVNNKTYSVMVYGLTDNNLWAADDYQYEKIEKDLINYFKENIPFSLYDYKLNFLDLITDYYSNNLENVLKYIGSIELYYVGENNLDIIEANKLQELWKNNYVNYSIRLINFKTKENLTKYKNANFKDLSLTSIDMKDIYIDSVMTINNNQNKFRRINNITNYEDKVYIYAYKDDTSHEISLSKLDNLDNYKNIYDELKNKKIEQVTNTYSILRTPSVLYIYFPTKTVNTNDNDNLFFAYECSINQEKKYYIDYYFGLDTKLKMGTYGDYYIILKNFSSCDIDSEIKFSLIKIR